MRIIDFIIVFFAALGVTHTVASSSGACECFVKFPKYVQNHWKYIYGKKTLPLFFLGKSFFLWLVSVEVRLSGSDQVSDVCLLSFPSSQIFPASSVPCASVLELLPFNWFLFLIWEWCCLSDSYYVILCHVPTYVFDGQRNKVAFASTEANLVFQFLY